MDDNRFHLNCRGFDSPLKMRHFAPRILRDWYAEALIKIVCASDTDMRSRVGCLWMSFWQHKGFRNAPWKQTISAPSSSRIASPVLSVFHLYSRRCHLIPLNIYQCAREREHTGGIEEEFECHSVSIRIQLNINEGSERDTHTMFHESIRMSQRLWSTFWWRHGSVTR